MTLISLEEFVAQMDEKRHEAWQSLTCDPDHPLLHLR
jgi:hypothetical protein